MTRCPSRTNLSTTTPLYGARTTSDFCTSPVRSTRSTSPGGTSQLSNRCRAARSIACALACVDASASATSRTSFAASTNSSSALNSIGA